MAKRLKKHLERLDAVGVRLTYARSRIVVLEARVRVLEGEAKHRDSLRVGGIIAARTRTLSALETLTNEILSILSEVESRG